MRPNPNKPLHPAAHLSAGEIWDDTESPVGLSLNLKNLILLSLAFVLASWLLTSPEPRSATPKMAGRPTLTNQPAGFSPLPADRVDVDTRAQTMAGSALTATNATGSAHVFTN